MRVDVNRVPLGDGYKVNTQSLGTDTRADFQFEYFPIGEDEEGSGWMTFACSPSRARRLANAGDVVYSTVRPLLRRCFVAPKHPAAVYSTGYAIIEAKEGWSRRFLYHWLTSNEAERQVYARLTGSGYPAISATDLEEVLVPKFELVEQRRIAAVLDAWDDAIAVAESLILAKRQRFAWVRSQILTGRVRLGSFKSEWQPTRLSEVLHEHGLKSTGAEAVYSVSVHVGLVNQIEHLGRSFAAANTDHYNRVRQGDIVYTKSPTGDFPLGVIKQSKLEREVIVSPLYGVFTPRSRELGVLLDALFSSPRAAERYLAPLVQKGAKNTIAVTNQQFLRGEILLPANEEEARAICGLVESAIEEISKQEAELELFRQQKRGLVQKLLATDCRLPESIDGLIHRGEVASSVTDVEAV